MEGLGATLVIPAIAALTAANYEGKARAVACGILGGVAGAAAAAGPLIGGFMTTYLSWRLVFAAETFIVMAGGVLLYAFALWEARQETKGGAVLPFCLPSLPSPFVRSALHGAYIQSWQFGGNQTGMNAWARVPRELGHVRPRAPGGKWRYTPFMITTATSDERTIPPWRSLALVVALLGVVVLVWPAGVSAAGQPLHPQPGPLSQAFVEALHDPLAGAFGKLPNPVEVHLGAAAEARAARLCLPPAYDLRAKGRLTVIKDQGFYGKCWAFANLAAVE